MLPKSKLVRLPSFENEAVFSTDGNLRLQIQYFIYRSCLILIIVSVSLVIGYCGIDR